MAYGPDAPEGYTPGMARQYPGVAGQGGDRSSVWPQSQPQQGGGFKYGLGMDPTAGGSGGGSENSQGGALGWLKSQEKRWAPGSASYAWQEGLPQEYQDRMNQAGANYDPNAGNINAARGLQATGRGGLLGALQDMQGRPLDSEALGATMMRAGQQQVAGNMAAQMASAPGRFNPAAMRQAQMGMSGAGQGMALQAQQQAMQSAVAERAARDANVRQGYGALDTNDVARMAQENALRQGDQNFWGKQQAAMQGWGQQGQGEKGAEWAARVAYDRARERGFYGQAPTDGGDAQAVAGAIGSAAGSLASGLGWSDRRAKRNVSPAAREVRTLLATLSGYRE